MNCSPTAERLCTAAEISDGTFVDDMLVYRMAPSHFMLVVNAANTAKDFAWISEQVKVASFALAPKPELIARLKEAGLVVVPSIGARRHAEIARDHFDQLGRRCRHAEAAKQVVERELLCGACLGFRQLALGHHDCG